jgi:hypothetical protein
MPGRAERTGLASTLAEAAAGCEQAIGAYLAGSSRRPGLHFSRPVTLAIALLAELAERGELIDEDLQLIANACGEAAAACRSQPPDPALLAATKRFSDVDGTCRAALDRLPAEPGGLEWKRFLFPDADVEVARDGGRWRIRAGRSESEQRLLDDALSRLLPPLSSSRIGELSVQILLWNSGSAAP